MAKKLYTSPVIVLGLSQDEDPTIILPGSQLTSGEQSRFTWDSRIDSNDIEMFWNAGYDETDLEAMDDGDFFISKAEFDKWFEEVMGGSW